MPRSVLAAAVAAIVVAVLALTPSGGRSADFANPVIAANVPDPSVTRAGGAFWATATSGSWAPLFPIFSSSDLVNWHRRGAVFQTAPAWAVGRFWAPDLSWWRGRFWLYYSASRRGGRPCVGLATSRHGTGPYADAGPVLCPPGGGIDATVEEDGRGGRVLLWKALGVGQGIYGAQLAPSGRRITGRARLLVRPDARWEQGVTEGPDLLERGGAFYLLYSGGHCCRPPCTYAEGVARAPAPLGPYVKHPANPILRGGPGWKCPGHGSVVEDKGGRVFFLHHAYRADDDLDVARQDLLEPVTFGADGWPVIGASGTPVTTGLAPFGLPQTPERSVTDTFGGRTLAPGWEWPFDDPPPVTLRGRLVLTNPTRRRGLLSPFISWTTTEWDYVAETTVRRGPGSPGIGVRTSDGAVIGVQSASGGWVEVTRISAGRRAIVSRRRLLGPATVQLRLDVRGRGAVGIWARPAGGRWTRVGPVQRAGPGAASDRVVLTGGGAPGTRAAFLAFRLLAR